MSESVKILIEAENKASAVVDQVAKDIDKNVKSIKETGEQAKKSTEFLGSLATALGGTELGSYASQIAAITDKTSQFAEVQKLGGTGLLAFKAGLVGVVGVLTFQLGKALGDLIFDTKRWNDELEKATKKGEDFVAKMAELKDFNFGRAKEGISLIVDPEEQLKASKELLSKIGKEIKEKQDSLDPFRAMKKQREESASIWSEEWADMNKVATSTLDKQIADGEEYIKQLSRQVLELQRSTDGTKERNAELARSGPLLLSLRNELLMIAATQSDIAKKSIFVGDTAATDALREEIRLLEQKQNITAFEERARQERLGKETAATTQMMIQVELAKKKADLAKEEVVANTKSRSFIDSLRKELASTQAARNDSSFTRTAFTGQDASIKSIKEEIQLLEERTTIFKLADRAKLGALESERVQAEGILLQIALTQKQLELGNAEQEQARRLADLKASELLKIEEQTVLLTKGKAAAYAFRLEQQGLSKQDAANIASRQRFNVDRPVLQASESRLLTRGDGEDLTKQTASNTARAVEELRALNKQLGNQFKNTTTLKVVSK